MTAAPRPAALLALAVAAGLVLGGCATGGTPGPSPSPAPSVAPTPAPSPSRDPTPSPTPSPSPSPSPDSPVDGVVIDVDAQGLADVESFTIRTDDGTLLTFRVGRLEMDSLPVGHLTEHAATGAPVRVVFVVENGELVMVSYADAD